VQSEQDTDGLQHEGELIRQDLLRKLDEDESESYLGELVVEGWMLGIFDAKVGDDGDVRYNLSEKGVDLVEEGRLRSYIQREKAGVDVEKEIHDRLPGVDSDE